MFADDVKIFAAIKKVEDCLEIKRSLDMLDLCCSANKMKLNVNKLKQYHFIVVSLSISYNV